MEDKEIIYYPTIRSTWCKPGCENDGKEIGMNLLEEVCPICGKPTTVTSMKEG